MNRVLLAKSLHITWAENKNFCESLANRQNFQRFAPAKCAFLLIPPEFGQVVFSRHSSAFTASVDVCPSTYLSARHNFSHTVTLWSRNIFIHIYIYIYISVLIDKNVYTSSILTCFQWPPFVSFPFWVKPSLDFPFRLGRILSSTHGCVGRFQWKRQACIISRGGGKLA